MLLRWLTLVVSLRITSPYSEFYEEILNIESPSDFWGTGVEGDQQGGDEVEVFNLEDGGEQIKQGVVRIDLETFKLDSHLVRDQVRELLSRTFGDSKLLDVSTLTTLVGPGVGVNNSRSAGFCLKINHRVENRLNKKVERTFSYLSGEEERSQRARVTDGGSEREPRRATQDSQGDQGDPSEGQENPQATSEAGKREVTEKLLGVVYNATKAIETARQDQNRRSSNVARGFGANAVFEPAGIFIMEDVSIYVPESLLRFAPPVKAITGYMGGFSWQHIFTAIFGAGSSTLPCSAKDLEQVLLEFDQRIPLVKNAAQAKIAISRLRREATVSLSCILSQKGQFSEALEVGYLLEELVDTYSQALPQVQASSQTLDHQSQGVILAELAVIQNSLARIKAAAVSRIEDRIEQKNNLAFWGGIVNYIGTMGTSWWKAQNSKDVLEKKRKEWSSMEAGDAEREFYWWLAGATFLQLGTWSAGYSYGEVLFMQQGPSRVECRSETILQDIFLSYPTVSNPREVLTATGSKLAAERHLKDFYREMILKNFCVLKEEEGAPLQAAIEEFLELALFLVKHV